MFCEKCGAVIESDTQPCPNCGYLVQPVATDSSSNQSPSVFLPTDIQKTEQKKWNPIGNIIVGVLIVGLLAGTIIILLLTNSKYTKNALKETAEETQESKNKAEEITTVLEKEVNIVLGASAKTEEESVATDESATEYIFADSNSRYLEEDEIYALSQDEMRYARNEIYARLGREFSDEGLQEYFNEKSWYEPKYSVEEFDELGDDALNEYELYNKDLITKIEKEMGY